MTDLGKRVVDLSKKAAFSVSRHGLEDFQARVVFVMDISKSMYPLYRDGTMQQVLERVAALALNFDDDGQVDVIVFGTDARYVGGATLATLEGFVAREIVARHNINGATNYARGMREVARLLPGPHPLFVVFLTDGNNGDRPETEALLRELSGQPVFFKFLGIGSERFAFLEKLDDLEGRLVDNADFQAISDIATIRDGELFERLLVELNDWRSAAAAAGLQV
ncbi:hypothetical protein HNR42_002509 [Deinobacterium chartae]|uniref:VWFA domain-containing protein n=1 Tax=Deinobacterium chartae TaxID=521158 RepID=A0A841I1G5_9DEIO|nr:VWA domain-containing protein [Deinobacterium chartae]MBB6099073.1 hypothetical protein [Deinobacterium chartae]